MEITKIVNLKKDVYDVYIGRSGKGKDGYFGNPFILHSEHNRGATLNQYREYFYTRVFEDDEFRKKVLELRGKTLGCFCKPFPCHGDIIAAFLNDLEIKK